jgi:hypothetical protein
LRLLIAAVGKLRDAPEAALAADYIMRAANTGRQLGFKSVDLMEVEAKPPGDPRAEASALFRATPVMTACRRRHSGSAAPTACRKALRIMLTKRSLLAVKLGRTGSSG